MQVEKSTLVTIAKLLNHFRTPGYNRLSRTPWDGEETNVNIATIRQKLIKSVEKTLKHISIYLDDTSQLHSYVGFIADQLGIKLQSREKTGYCTSITPEEYNAIIRFMSDTAKIDRLHPSSQILRFVVNNSLHGILNFLVTKETIENKTGNTSFDSAMQQLLTRKKPEFFENGIIEDWFVSDRMAISAKPMTILVRKDRLSTRVMVDARVPQNDCDYHRFKIA